MIRFFSLIVSLVGLATGGGYAADVQTLHVTTFNIHHAEGMDGVVDVERIANVILNSRADIVALQEVDRGVERTSRMDIPRELEKLTGFDAVFGKTISHQGGEYGNAILSRYSIVQSSNHHYQMIPPKEQRGLLTAVIEIGDQKVVVASTHLGFGPDDDERLHHADELIRQFRSAADTPVIVCGDFNDVPDSHVHRKLRQSFTDAWEDVGQGDGFTFSSRNPTRRLDYVFFSPQDVLSPNLAAVVQSKASDHLPLTVSFTIHSNDDSVGPSPN